MKRGKPEQEGASFQIPEQSNLTAGAGGAELIQGDNGVPYCMTLTETHTCDSINGTKPMTTRRARPTTVGH
jgi:hypothetical protein